MAESTTTPIEEGTTTPETGGTASTAQTASAEQSGGRTYTQEEVDELVSGLLTQEQFNRAVAAERKKERARFKDYDEYKSIAESRADYDEVVAERDRLRTEAEAHSDYDQLKGELDGLRAKAERRDLLERVSEAVGVPTRLLSMLTGTTEEELTEQAKTLRGVVPAYPTITDDGDGAGTEPITKDEILAEPDRAKRLKLIEQHMDLFS